MREFEWIARHFAPLTEGTGGALDLKDDAAVLPLNGLLDLVATVDAMVAGRHFLETDPPDLVARKLVRVNLSDLAAMGAVPTYALLATAWPDTVAEDWIARFAHGLAQDQALLGLKIVGGDTVATPGPMTLSLTALGTVPSGQALLRSGAQPGDRLYVSGVIGDGGLGLKLLKGEGLRLSHSEARGPIARFQLPEPRLALGQALLGVASAAMDVSDGLVQDAGHLARASGVQISIEIEKVPASAAAGLILRRGSITRETLATTGDDYELLFAVPPDKAPAAEAAAKAAGVPITPIGDVQSGEEPGVTLFDGRGNPVAIAAGGYSHF